MSATTARRSGEIAFASADVAAVFGAYPPALRSQLMRLRRLIFDVAAATDGVGPLDETLKWGQPSYLTGRTGSGSTIRIDRTGDGRSAAMFFICHTNLVDTFRQLYPDALRYEGNRSIVLGGERPVDHDALRHCISLALTYHLRRRQGRKSAAARAGRGAE